MICTKKQLTIGVPVYNEEHLIATTIEAAYKTAKEVLDDFEIIVLDDGSTDHTYEIVQKVISKYGPQIQVFRKKKNEGVGSAFHYILGKAKFPYISIIPGDNAYATGGIKQLFSKVGAAPLVISFREAMSQRRTKLRYFLSRTLTVYLKLLSGKRIRDAHSLYIFPVDVTRSLNVKNNSYGYHVEILSRLLRRTESFYEFPVDLNPNPDASSGVMHVRVLTVFAITLFKLFGLRIANKL